MPWMVGPHLHPQILAPDLDNLRNLNQKKN